MQPWFVRGSNVLICIGASWFARFPPSALSSLARVHVGTGGGLDDGGDLEDEEVEDGHAEAAVTAAPMCCRRRQTERAAPRPQQSPTRHARRGTTAAVNSVLGLNRTGLKRTSLKRRTRLEAY